MVEDFWAGSCDNAHARHMEVTKKAHPLTTPAGFTILEIHTAGTYKLTYG